MQADPKRDDRGGCARGVRTIERTGAFCRALSQSEEADGIPSASRFSADRASFTQTGGGPVLPFRTDEVGHFLREKGQASAGPDREMIARSRSFSADVRANSPASWGRSSSRSYSRNSRYARRCARRTAQACCGLSLIPAGMPLLIHKRTHTPEKQPTPEGM